MSGINLKNYIHVTIYEKCIIYNLNDVGHEIVKLYYVTYAK